MGLQDVLTNFFFQLIWDLFPIQDRVDQRELVHELIGVALELLSQNLELTENHGVDD